MKTYTFENYDGGDNPIQRDVFEVAENETVIAESTGETLSPGWYWIPARMVVFDPTGPFKTEDAAIADARP